MSCIIPVGLAVILILTVGLAIRHAYETGLMDGLDASERTATGLPSRVLFQDVKPAPRSARK